MRLSEHDHPIEECAKTAQALIADGAHVMQKFTCENCRSRQTMGVPDRFYTTGQCEACGHVSNIAENGCNYVVVGSVDLATGRFVQDSKIEQAILAVRDDVVRE